MASRANPNYTFMENYSSGFSTYINSNINQGVGFFNYRGYIGMSGWDPSGSLINGSRLPHATILTCSTGNFENDTATTEQFIRLGTSVALAGAITAIECRPVELILLLIIVLLREFMTAYLLMVCAVWVKHYLMQSSILNKFMVLL